MIDSTGAGRAARQLALALGAAAAAAAAGGCASRGGPVPYETAALPPPDVEAITPPASQQRIGPLDKLRVTVFQVNDLSGEFQVDARGTIQFPLIGEIEAQGKLPSELGSEIGRRLSQRYLRDPNVQVQILEQLEQTITVDGSVRQPGVLPIRGTTTLMRAVALARGTSEDANPARVVVFRTVNGEQLAAAFDLRAIRRAEADDPVIYGNDIIVVDGSRARMIWRDVMSSIPVLGLFAPIIR